MKHTLFTILALLSLSAHAQIITTIAGNDSVDYCCDGELAVHAGLYLPTDMVIDASGNIYITDGGNNRIRKIDISGIISTIAGTGNAGYNGDGIAATSADLNYPSALTLDANGDIYFCDDHNFRIRMINVNGIISTVAGTGVRGYNGENIPATSAQISSSAGIATDANNIYFTSIDSCRILKIDRSTGTITTFAGNGVAGYSGDGGPATNAKLNSPFSLTIDAMGNIFFSEHGSNCVRKINSAGIISTIAGNGIAGYNGDNVMATQAELNFPCGIATDNAGYIYITESNGNRIRKINPVGSISTIAGNGLNGFYGDGGLATQAKLFNPTGITVDNAGSLYIADWRNNRIRYVKNTASVTSIDNSIINIRVYPNPATENKFSVEVLSINQSHINIIIMDISGNKVAEIAGDTNKPISVQLDVATGLYILYAGNGQSVSTAKINIIR